MRGSLHLTYAVVLLALQDLNTVLQGEKKGIAEMSMVPSAPFTL